MASALLTELSLLIETRLSSLVSEALLGQDLLLEAVKYSLLSSGKRLRPLLVLLSGRLFQTPCSALLETACALEMIHTYSLIHDDLPCMDNDDFRRGKPSLHKAYSEGLALLTGDFLLTHAFEILAYCQAIDSEKKVALLQTLSHASGNKGMLGGQVMDLYMPIPDWPTLKKVHLLKTASLIQAAVVMGAIVAEAPLEEKNLLSLFGECLGLAFQIRDDLEDQSDDPIKKNSALLLGKAVAQKKLDALTAQAKGLLSQLNRDTSALSHYMDYLLYETAL